MRSNAKVNRTKKAANNSSSNTKSMDQDKRNVDEELANAKRTKKSILAQNSVLNTQSSYYDIDSMENEGSRNDLDPLTAKPLDIIAIRPSANLAIRRRSVHQISLDYELR